MTTPRYLPVEDFQDWARNTIEADEDVIEVAINASEEWIDSASGRYLTPVTVSGMGVTADVTRKFRPGPCSTILTVPDLAAITSITENGSTLTLDTDYHAEPFNLLDPASGTYRPYDRLVRLDTYWYTNGPRATVSVVGKWGWATIPAVVIEACCILTNDWLTNRDVRLGVVGADSDGFSIGIRQNPYVMSALNTIRGPMAWGIA